MYFRYIINIAGQSSLVARRAHNPKVVGSNPSPATNKWSRSVVVNMSACHAEDHGFKSRRDRHFFGPVAQSVEQETENLCVGSSILPWTTFNKNTRCQGHLFLFSKFKRPAHIAQAFTKNIYYFSIHSGTSLLNTPI